MEDMLERVKNDLQLASKPYQEQVEFLISIEIFEKNHYFKDSDLIDELIVQLLDGIIVFRSVIFEKYGKKFKFIDEFEKDILEIYESDSVCRFKSLKNGKDWDKIRILSKNALEKLKKIPLPQT